MEIEKYIERREWKSKDGQKSLSINKWDKTSFVLFFQNIFNRNWKKIENQK